MFTLNGVWFGVEANFIMICTRTKNDLDYCINYQKQSPIVQTSSNLMCTDCFQRQISNVETAATALDGTFSFKMYSSLFSQLCSNANITEIVGVAQP
jgi:hypothetical protein